MLRAHEHLAAGGALALGAHALQTEAAWSFAIGYALIVACLAARDLADARRAAQPPPADIIVVGCGVPGQSMGAVHAVQLLTEPRMRKIARLRAIVEPFFLSHPDASEKSGFADFHRELSKEHPHVQVVDSVGALAPASGVDEASNRRPRGRRPTLALVATRTADMPRVCAQLLAPERVRALGLTGLYLEKPGAPDSAGCAEIERLAAAVGVHVYVGYNKNVARYAETSLARVRALPGRAHVELVHDNDFTREQLAEVFERCAEGCVRNMACHELGLAVCVFGLRAAELRAGGGTTVHLDRKRTALETINGRTDFSKLAFTLRRAGGGGGGGPRDDGLGIDAISFVEDRCGGKTSSVRVRAAGGSGGGFGAGLALGGAGGSGWERFMMPDPADADAIAARLRDMPGMRTYFATQWDDYLEIKERVVAHNAAALATGGGTHAREQAGAAAPSPGPDWPAGVASIGDAQQVLLLAEQLDPLLRRLASEPGAVIGGHGLLDDEDEE